MSRACELDVNMIMTGKQIIGTPSGARLRTLCLTLTSISITTL